MMPNHPPGDFSWSENGQGHATNSTSHPRTRDQILFTHQPNYLSTHVTPNPNHRAPVLGQFSPSPTPPRRNNTSKDIKPVIYPSLESFQWSNPPVTPERLPRSLTRIAPGSQLPANGFPAPVPRCFDENPFINHAQSEWEQSFSANAESRSTTLTYRLPDDPFANSQSSNRAAIQRTTVKDEPHSQFFPPLAGDYDDYPNRRSAFQSSTITPRAPSSLATPPATTRKLHPNTFVPQGTPLRKNLQLDSLQTPPVKLETRPSILTPPSTIQFHAGIYQSPEGTPLRRSNFIPTAGSINELSPSRPSGAGSSKSLAKKGRTKTTNNVPSNDLMDLAKCINNRSSRDRNRDTHPVIFESNETDVAVESSSDALPRQLQSWFFEGSAGIFKNGQKLKNYQAADLRRLVLRELGEEVCGTDVIHDVGFVVAYEMGLGKTVITIALILINPAPEDFEGARATLVVVPNKGMMDQWVSELKKFAPHLKVCYYGSCSSHLQPDADVVLVTYAQVLLQHGAFKADPDVESAAPLFHYFWWRKVDDEAHKYRNPETMTAKAVWAVQKQHALCLTGTPVQNSLLDFYPLFKTLGVTHEGIHDLQTYQRKIYKKGQKGPITNSAALRLLNLLKENFCIFRAKTDAETGEALVDLPPRTDNIVEVYLSAEERYVYNRVKEAALPIFAKLIRRRQACDHPTLIPRALAMDLKLEDEAVDDFDSPDVKRALLGPSSLAISECPKAVQGLFNHSYLSSKLAAMIQVLQKCSGQKTIIFTHFTSLIPSIAKALYRAKICWTEYTGAMDSKDQRDALKEIATNKECSVIIISILAGSTGLNITSCNNVILLEPWWNPYTEEQAISRVHRIGQTRPVNVYHLVVKDSIEMSIMKTQLQKREMVGDMYGSLDLATQKAWLAGP